MTLVKIALTDDQLEAAAIASLKDSLKNVDVIGLFDQSDDKVRLISALKLVLEFYGVKTERSTSA